MSLLKYMYFYDMVTTLFMIFSVTYIICEGPNLDAWRFQSARPLIANMYPFVKQK